MSCVVVTDTGKGMMANFVVNTIRSLLNTSLKQVKPGQLVKAIYDNVSLLDIAGEDITKISHKIPKSIIDLGRPMYIEAIQQYGGATGLVIEWMKIDNPNLYSLLLNTNGGMAWFDRQVFELTKNIGLEYK